VAVVAAAAAAAASGPEVPESVRSLQDAERQLSAAAARDGARQALADRLSPLAILLAPRPVSARVWLQEHPPAEGRWTWTPEFVLVSGLGDLGCAFGSWRVEPTAEGGATQGGSYVSVWRFHPQTGWKVLLQAASPCPAGAPAAADTAEVPFAVAGPPVEAPHGLQEKERAGLIEADREFARTAGRDGLRAAYRRWAAPDVRLAATSRPAVGALDALPNLVDSLVGTLECEPVASRTAGSADLGYTFGICRWLPSGGGAPDEWSYARVWRRDAAGGLRLAVEVRQPVPPRE
jgi:ketosteroid isomerase-like protein